MQEGDHVAGGTVLARVQQTDYRAQVNSAKAQLNEAGRIQATAQLRATDASVARDE